ncbi:MULTISPECIES: beta/gamma crystallin domain-containing protein [unclassified Streptomyces]|uniref:beta/gamma crystallin domain-containing protein n=1 Tax=unclassified Streptomyces TaxID=2593676 RepID=UPI001317BC1B|nr:MULTISPECIES: beta/gamma crystallin domain-containing protein [unclassified Streptomyces]QHC29659.1 oxidoreductase [Streptomyces sp. HF10]WKE71497.1 beta/gamma crystallin domain-containing protein [Streptomyces sp. WP-1]
MNSKYKRAARSAAMALAAAAALVVSGPSGSAFAIDHVECRGGENFLKIWSHSGGSQSVDCYANRGRTNFGGWWVDRISTGNNDLIYYDANGDSVRIGRWHDISFPNRPPKVNSIEIL